MTTLHVKHLRIYNKDHLSYRKLREKNFFRFIDNISTETDREILLEVLIEIVRAINISDTWTNDLINRRIELIVKRIQISKKAMVDSYLLSTFKTKFINEYRSTNYVDKFRGDVVEYIMMYLEVSTNSILLHEPKFRHKRKNLVSNTVWGRNCLVDVVKINRKKNFSRIDLFECKANLNTCISYINRKDSFKKKLNYMDELENLLVNYIYDECYNHLGITKNLVSLITPQTDIPSIYQNFNSIDLLRRFKLGQSIV